MRWFVLSIQSFIFAIIISFCLMSESYAADGSTPYRARLSLQHVESLTSHRSHNHNGKRTRAVRISGRIRGVGHIDARFSRRRWKQWQSFMRKQGVDAVDPIDPILLQGSVAVGGGWRKTGRRIYPTSASIIAGELKMTFPGRVRGKAKRRQRVYTIRIKMDGSISVRARVRSIPRSIGRTGACASAGENLVHSAVSAQIDSSDDDVVILPIDGTSDTETSKVVTISTDADPEWYQLYGDKSNAVIASIVNDAEAIYSRQLGIRFRIVKQHVYTDGSPYGTSDPGAMLSRFTRNRENGKNLANNSGALDEEVDIKHLFTGKDFDGGVIGIAYIGVVCSVPGLSYGITQHYMDIADVGIFAHELGHNFGADHDSSRRDAIMYPSISVPPAMDFSSVSVSEIQKHLAKYDSCISYEELEPLPEDPNYTPIPNIPQTPNLANATLRVRRNRVRRSRRPMLRLRGQLTDADGKAIGGVPISLLVAGEEVAQGVTSPNGNVKFFVRLLAPPDEKVYVYLETANGEVFSNFLWMGNTSAGRRR